MRKFVIAAVLLVAACSSTSNSPTTTPAPIVLLKQVGCEVDGVVQPLAMQAIASLGAASVTAATADVLLVHPLVIAACKSVNGVPASPECMCMISCMTGAISLAFRVIEDVASSHGQGPSH